MRQSSALAEPHPSTAGPAILVENLVKSYGGKRAVDGLSFEVDRGQIVALLGPNGAGKTTTVEILESFRKPDAGRVEVLGLNVETQAEELKPRMGVMLQNGGLYPAITPREALDLFAHFYPSSREPDELLKAVGLVEVAGTRYRRLSGGEKQRLRLAIAMIGCPEIIFLDEPTAGLDPHARRATWGLIASLRERGTTVVLTTHYLEEAERLADRIAIIDHGKLIAMGSTAQLTHSDRPLVWVRAASGIDLALIRRLSSARAVREDHGSIAVETADAGKLLMEMSAVFYEAGVQVEEMRVGNASLEDTFLRLTGREFEE